jgi:hypothetical protein
MVCAPLVFPLFYLSSCLGVVDPDLGGRVAYL